MNRKPRQRMCKICRTKYQPQSSFQKACSIKCAIEYTNLDKAKQRRKQDAKERERLKPRSKHLADVQKVFNKYIRLKKRGNCISCGSPPTSYNPHQAGHFYSTASRPDLRYTSDNVWQQCLQCNTHLSGNQAEYKKRLILIIGQERVDALEVVGRSDWSIEELKAIKKKYQDKIKEIK